MGLLSDICLICSNVSEVSIRTPCGRKFCKSCLLAYVARKFSCPNRCCRIKLSDLEQLKIPKEKEVVKVRCKYSSFGCPTVVPLREMDSHVIDCKFRTVKCDCGRTMTASQLDDHWKICRWNLCGKCHQSVPKDSNGNFEHDCVESLKKKLEEFQLDLKASQVIEI